MEGFGARRISFTGNQIQVDWELLFYTPNTIVKLDITPSPAPEPSSLALAGVGVAGLLGYGWGRWRKARSS
jgi:hypothetical protein